MGVKGPFTLDNLRGIIMFLSYSGNGHSLISSLLDAHKHVIISREQITFIQLADGKVDLDYVYGYTVQKSYEYTLRGRPHKGSNSYHEVPGLSNGVTEELQLIGDKCGLRTLSMIHENEKLDTLKDKTGLPIYFIRVQRNLFDVVAHARRFYSHHNTDTLIEKVDRRQYLMRNASNVVGRENIFDINFDHFVQYPRQVLQDLLNFLGLEAYEGYIDGCASIVNPKLTKEAHMIKWTKENYDMVKEMNYASK